MLISQFNFLQNLLEAKVSLTILGCFFVGFTSANMSISINASETVFNQSISNLAMQDVQQLLQDACNCEVSFNTPKANIQINLPKPIIDPFNKIKHQKESDGVAYFYYPSTAFEWSAFQKENQLHLKLKTQSYEGIATALYALLQEQLGFRFYHPKEMIVPAWESFPIRENFYWTAKERFVKRGFHLHTMHPIELTEALLDPEFPNGLALVKEYIDWLVRNGQNYFEFNLLRTVNLNTWLPYAQQFTDYAHQRGIIMGIDISLHMIQQKAFMLYEHPPKSFKAKSKQVLHNLNTLHKANWDVYNIELSSTEYTSGNHKRQEKILKIILDWATENHTKIMGRAHVVKKEKGVLNYSTSTNVEDHNRGVMIHTVMFYQIDEAKAPVYGNENLLHMLDLMDTEQQLRETWYFPESAYWVTFDSSIPMLLLPYFSARLNDILLMEEKGIQGHLTFSSGWEWGYGLIDWSIARWSWDYDKPVSPMDAFDLLFEDDSITKGLNKLLSLQNQYLKEKELIRYLVAQTVADEVPKMFSLEFHPTPKWRYKYLFRKANKTVLDSLDKEVILPLQQFYFKYDSLLNIISSTKIKNKKLKPVFDELIDGLKITALRTKHRIHCLKAIHAHRMDELNKSKNVTYLNKLKMATEVRKLALTIVKQREANYRYDLDMLSTQRKGHSAYHFGYLYPVSNLHFWEREEAQIKQNRWGFGFKNIWNVWRIVGF